MKHWTLITALAVVTATVAVAAGQHSNAPVKPTRGASAPAVLGVEALMKQPQRHQGRVQVEGVVSAVAPKQQTLVLIDTAEFQKCGTVECAELALPVHWTGPMPAVAKAIRLNGQIEKRGGKLIFVAQTLTPVKLPTRTAR